MVFFVESIKNKRARNEDNYCHMELRINHEASVIAYAVADGMGGLTAGDDYAKKAISIWYEELVRLLMSDHFRACSLDTQIDSLKEFSKNVFSPINEKLYQMGMDAGIRGGTTLSTAIFFWDTWIFANCGDSPIYFMRNRHLELASQIQNLAWQMVREGKTQEGSLLFEQNKNRLLQYLGRREEVLPYSFCLDAKKVDLVLMGTDGAFGDMTREQMEGILCQDQKTDKVLSDLLQFARNLGETDNQTAMLIYPSTGQNSVMADKKERMEMADMSLVGKNDTQEERREILFESEKRNQRSSYYRSIQEESMRERFKSFWKGRRS